MNVFFRGMDITEEQRRMTEANGVRITNGEFPADAMLFWLYQGSEDFDAVFEDCKNACLNGANVYVACDSLTLPGSIAWLGLDVDTQKILTPDMVWEKLSNEEKRIWTDGHEPTYCPFAFASKSWHPFYCFKYIKRVSEPESTVYFIEALSLNRIKIGKANDPEKRLRSLQTGSPVKLSLLKTIPGDVDLERKMHSIFESSRISGEWFHASESLREFISELV